MSRKIHYYVEGKCEKVFIKALQKNGIVRPGKVDVFNAVQNLLASRIHTLGLDVVVVFIFDVDKGPGVLLKNIIETEKMGARVICLPQVYDFEDEIKRSCMRVKAVKEITESRSNKDFKSDFCSCSNIFERLSFCGFTSGRMWRTPVPSDFERVKKYIHPEYIF